MYKKCTLAILAIFCCFSSFSQSRKGGYGLKNTGNSCPKLYLGTSTGINNASGLLGVNLDVPITESFSIGGGAGIASWGYKVYGEGRFYFDPCNRGWALGAGVSHNTGIANFPQRLETTTGEKEVIMDLHPLTNVFFSGYRFWDLGRSGHRFDLRVGYSACLTSNQYTVKSNDVLTNVSKAAMEVTSPGGIIIGIGFTFAIAR